MEQQARWNSYYRATAKRPARETLQRALSAFESNEPVQASRFAIDLGCGAGNDTFELLQRGWQVLAIDNQPEALTRVRLGVPDEQKSNLRVQHASFETIKLPPADLINASFTLPFCAPEHFENFWAKIVAAIRPGGRFAGHFFGINDGWANNPKMTFHTIAQVEKLLSSFLTEFFLETDEPGQTANGQSKHWHVFGVVGHNRLES